jgi:hypothetical protein
MDDIVDLTSFHDDMRDLSLFMQVKDRYLTRDFPAWTAIGACAAVRGAGLHHRDQGRSGFARLMRASKRSPAQ